MNLDSNFVIPNKPEDLTAIPSDERYYVQDFFNASELDEAEQSTRLDDVIKILFSEDPADAGTIENVFSELYCFIWELEKIEKEE